SRRRHTRFDCDWSSDVCSSDLNAAFNGTIQVPGAGLFTNKAVFIHRATVANSAGDFTKITHPMSDGDPNAILIVTPNWNPGGLRSEERRVGKECRARW